MGVPSATELFDDALPVSNNPETDRDSEAFPQKPLF
jgi:hypothetical protein